jgi:secondary thiamine-phosphate synthase enzyme
MKQSILTIQSDGKGLYELTALIKRELGTLPAGGLLNVFVTHTSASLLIQENADPTARADLETFYEKLAPEGQGWHRHTLEGADDTTSHLKASLMHTSLNIPIVNGTLGLGTWQGIYLFEHRNAPHSRRIILSVVG